MLLTITYKGNNTTDLGYLLYKNPNRPQVFKLNYGSAYVFYKELSYEKTTVCLLLDIDPIDLAKGKVDKSTGGLFDYVNDRPYVSSSFMSTAISKVFGTAMTGRADNHQQLADSPINLSATINMLSCNIDKQMLNKVFEPLNYNVYYETFILDEVFTNWGESKYVNLTIEGVVKLKDLLSHLYVLIPVFDRQKHYWVGKDEVEKLLKHGEIWLKNHPEKLFITGRYLNRSSSLINLFLNTLEPENISDDNIDSNIKPKQNLNTKRLETVLNTAKACKGTKIIDIGCGEGKLLSLLIKVKQFEKITGVDVSYTVLERAKSKLKLDKISDYLRDKIELFQGSVTYKDKRFEGYDIACIVEVIEHLDISRLKSFERVIFEFAKPKTIIITTPNKDYNKNYINLPEGKLRHGDHRFEWDKHQFIDWATKVCKQYNYTVVFSDIGESDEKSYPTQMGVFTLCEQA